MISKQQGWRFKRLYKTSNDEVFIKKVLDKPDFFLLEKNADKIFKHDKTTTVALISSKGKQYILKRYNARSFLHTLKRALRRTRAWRCWEMSQAFTNAGINVAPATAYLEKRWGPFKGDAYFLSEYIAGELLLEYLPKQNKTQQAKIAKEIENVFKKMHEARITHGDMKATNLLWYENKIYFIDLDAASKHINHLSWLRSNKRDKRRFMKNWQTNKKITALFSMLV